MRKRQLTEVVMVTIPKPCGESWDAMVGGEDKRLCAGCGCHVHNLAGMPASEVEALLQAETKVCTRIMADPVKGILTRDGWVSRLVLTGAVAVGMAGCGDPVAGESAVGKLAAPVESQVPPSLKIVNTIGYLVPAETPVPVMGDAVVETEPADRSGRKVNPGKG
jgi:hypothetical protein